jgi:hypothetical protein
MSWLGIVKDLRAIPGHVKQKNLILKDSTIQA